MGLCGPLNNPVRAQTRDIVLGGEGALANLKYGGVCQT